MKYYQDLKIEDIHYIDDDGISKIEEWKDIPDYFGKYQASTLGRVKSSMPHNGTFERILRQTPTKKGYVSCGLYKNKKRGSFLIHRLIAITYIPNPQNLPEVNHKKGDKKDNRPCAIEWSTHNDNISHAVENSLIQKGEKCHRAKLTEKQVLEIRASNDDAKYLSVKYNISKNTIWQVKRKAIWAHI
jgi:hypothetical protein